MGGEGVKIGGATKGGTINPPSKNSPIAPLTIPRPDGPEQDRKRLDFIVYS
jgi:hypothetical protein